jgi:hypothetical protein
MCMKALVVPLCRDAASVGFFLLFVGILPGENMDNGFISMARSFAMPLALRHLLKTTLPAAGMVWLALGNAGAQGQLPPWNLWVEFRWISEAQALAEQGSSNRRGGFEVSTGAGAGGVSTLPSSGPYSGAGLNGRLLQVLNGQRASVRLSENLPVQWVQSAQGPAGGQAGAGSGPGVSFQTSWLQAGQSLSVQPRWPGGNQPATLEVQVEDTQLTPHSTHAMAIQGAAQVPGPTTRTHQTSTTLAAPLGQWVTLGIEPSEGPAAGSGWVASTRGRASSQRMILQVRVRAQ